MLRRLLGQDPRSDFTARGGEVLRLEGYSDCVFAFALTLLVVSLEVPRTFDQLLRAAPEFAAFALCFALFTVVWYHHYVFFRRYPVHDRPIIVLNSALLFLVLFSVYPLKFMAGVVYAITLNLAAAGYRWASLGVAPTADLGSPLVTLPSGQTVKIITIEQLPSLMAMFIGGGAALLLIFGLMYRHAWRRREVLGLSAEGAARAMNAARRAVLAAAALAVMVDLVLAVGSLWPLGAPYVLLLVVVPIRVLRWRAGTRSNRAARAAAGTPVQALPSAGPPLATERPQ
jgi:hypothetical protein